MAPRGLLLVNLGTPASPRPAEVRRYLKEFLSDGRVVDLPAWRRWLVLHLFVLPWRPRRSADAYAKIWTGEGSPLLVHGRALAARVQERLGEDVTVELAMRYGEPSIPRALGRLRERGVRQLVVFPLYPQYAPATTGSTLEAVFRELSRWQNVPAVATVPAFYDHPAFIAALAARAREALAGFEPERVFFSYHGLPESQVRAADPTRRHCLAREDCCTSIGEANAQCYRAQCFATSRALAAALGYPWAQCAVCFQSRMGRRPWIRPYTDEAIRAAAREGIRRVAVFSPAFVADCLETLEEIGLRAAADFRAHGGDRLVLVPSLNDSEAWVRAVLRIAGEASPWLGAPARACGTDGGRR